MRKVLNFTIVFSSILLALILLTHLTQDTYFQIEGFNNRFPGINKDETKAYISIKQINSRIECEVNFVDVKSGIRVDTFNFILLHNNDSIKPAKDVLRYFDTIEAGAGMRSFQKNFKLEDPTIDKYFLKFILKYQENEKVNQIDLAKYIQRKKDYFIGHGDMGDPTTALIPFFEYLLIITVTWRIFLQVLLLKRKKASKK